MKKMNVLKLLVVVSVLMVFAISSCKKFELGCETGSGDLVDVTREVAFFNKVEIGGSCEVYFRKSDRQTIRIVAEDNIAPLIETFVRSDGTLVIYSTRSYSTDLGVKVYLTMTDIRGFYILGSGRVMGEEAFSSSELVLDISGSGSMEMQADAQQVVSNISGAGSIRLTVNAREMVTNINGSGDIHLMGSTDVHSITIAAAGNVEALELDSVTCVVVISGSGNSRVRVRGLLDVVISGSGNVYFTGNPVTINSVVTGSGGLIALD